MTVIRPKHLPPMPKPVDRADLKSAVKQGIAQVKDGFQATKPRPVIDPAMIETRTHCFPDLSEVFEGEAGKIGEKIKDVLSPRPPFDTEAVDAGLYNFRLRNMTPKELFVEEAKQREILEDASTGPIQDQEAAAKAEERLAAIEAERGRRASDDNGPMFPPRLPDLGPLGAPVHNPDKEIA